MTLVSNAGFPRGMAGADLNGDGRLDLVTALGTGMGVFPNNGGFSFGSPVISSTSPYKFRLADFNNDGKPDVGMILDQTEVYEVDVATALGLGGGLFAPAQTQRGSNTAESLRISDDLDVADFDGDGHVDLLTFNYASNDVSVFLNTGNGALAPQQRYGIGNTPGLGTVGDFNADGRPDVAASIGLPPSGLDNAIVLLLSVASAPVSLVVDAAGNGVLEPNETVVMAPTWRNTSAAALAVTGGVSDFTGPAGPTYAILDASADYGTIAAGDPASCGADCYSLQVTASSRPSAHWDATILETVTPTGAAKTWTLHVGASFTDVSTDIAVNPFYPFIETIFHEGVTERLRRHELLPAAEQPAPGDGGVSAQGPPGLGLRSSRLHGRLPGRALSGDSGVSLLQLHRGSVHAGHHDRLPGRPAGSLLPGRGRDPGPDVGVPAQGAPGQRLRAPKLHGRLPGRALSGDSEFPFSNFVEDLSTRGITAGCQVGPPVLYCPDNPVTREQMAVFLTKTFGLVLYGP